MRQFYLIRHAESLGNIALSGSVDAGLSPLGRSQAAHCSEVLTELIGLEETLVLSSPMERCLDTSEIIASKLRSCEEVKLEPILCESFGEYNLPMGYKPDSLKTKTTRRDRVVGEYDDAQWWSMEHDTAESLAIRMAMLRNRLLGDRDFDFPVVVCVGHWPTIAALAKSMTSEAALRKVDNAAITKIIYDEEFKLELLNAYVYGTD